MFDCRLVGYIGITLEQVRDMPIQDWQQLRDYYELEPFGFVMDNLRHGQIIAAQHAASSRNFKPKAKDPKSFMFKRPRRTTTQSVLQSLSAAIPKGQQKKRGQ